MEEALIGLVGAVLGLLIGSSITFWSTRRSELDKAVVATTVLTEELRELRSADGSGSDRDIERARVAWREQRTALVRLLRPSDYDVVAAAVARSFGTGSAPPDDLLRTMEGLREALWAEHQAFILTPLTNFLRRRPLSNRLHAAVRAAREGSSEN